MEPRGRRQQSRRAALAAERALRTAPIAQDWALQPTRLLRNAHLQSTLCSLPPLSSLAWRRASALRAAAKALVLDCGAGVSLHGLHSAQPPSTQPEQAKPRLAVILHGWEGSANSTCVLALGAELFAAGYAVLRLNLRDHGGSQHLNRDIFHCGRLEDVVGALQAIARQFAPASLYLAGFSVGGNFLLRAAADPGLPAQARAVVAVSPVLDPAATLAALERGIPIYRRAFVRRWSRSLRRKQRAWPQLHDFSQLLRLKDLRAMTSSLVHTHTDFADLDAYLRAYDITGSRLAAVAVPCSVLLAEDDPMVPAADLARLARTERLCVWRSRFGGHCGFLGD
ncbi:MAG TPA: alpha/beta fold hydrolase, partial [Steroidobacteraceae bacterium]|nr:alpha/beta fold hydrolase [Steroidobacteraceae bacterium]